MHMHTHEGNEKGDIAWISSCHEGSEHLPDGCVSGWFHLPSFPVVSSLSTFTGFCSGIKCVFVVAIVTVWPCIHCHQTSPDFVHSY